MRNSFEAVPKELEEAAVIHGCSSWQALLKIYLPAIRPAIVTVSLFAFITSWNEFLAALVIMNRGSTFTLPLVLAAARQETSIGGTDWGMLQAGVTISVIPCVLFYFYYKIICVRFLSGGVSDEDGPVHGMLGRLLSGGRRAPLTILDVARAANFSIALSRRP